MILNFGVKSQINAYFNSAIFNTPANNPYLETSLTFIGQSLGLKKINNNFQNSVTILFTVFKDTVIVKKNKYNLLSQKFTDSTSAPNFIDQQRYALPNGTYQIEMSISDNYDLRKKALVIKDVIEINYNTSKIESSSIQMLENFSKTKKENTLSKSGYDLIPYCVNYYPESSEVLLFYFETYNTDTVIGKNKFFVYYFYIENSTDLKKIESIGSFKKEKCLKINPLLAKLNIKELITGNYNLVIEIKDENNSLKIQKKIFFQRMNKTADKNYLNTLIESKSIANYFGQCNNADTLKMFVECLWPIANNIDKERIINQSLLKDNDLMKKFVIDFWERRANDTANPLKLWGNYYKNVQTVMALFKCGKQKGYYSERGRVFLQYGAPSQRSQQKNDANTFPYEIWQYYDLTDATNSQHFANRKFVFVNKIMGDDCYLLLHSDMRGELYNDKWRFEVTRRNNNGLSNPDNINPSNTENNQFNNLFNNPQ